MGMWGQHYSPERDGYGKPGDYSPEGMGMEGQTIILLRGGMMGMEGQTITLLRGMGKDSRPLLF